MPPPAPRPSVAPPDPGSIASLGLSPTLLTGLFVSLLRQHFADPAGGMVLDPGLRHLYWAPDPANPAAAAIDSPLVVASVAAWDPTVVGDRPSLVVCPGPWSAARIAINDQVQNFRGPDGALYFANVVRGGHRVLAVGASVEGGDLAARLGFEAWQFLQMAAPLVRERFGLARLEVPSLGPASATVEGAQQHPAAPITIEYVINQTWAALVDEPRLRRVVWDISVQPT